MIELNIDGGVATVTLNRPPANAFSREGLLQLRDTIQQLEANPAVRALVITGTGPKFFSAGADLNTFASGDKAVALAMISAFGLAFEALAETHLVTVAAINGFAMGGGLECALACDIRIAEEHAQMALPEATVGLLPGGTGTQTLAWLVGEGWAKRMVLTGERVDAATALRIGLVEEWWRVKRAKAWPWRRPARSRSAWASKARTACAPARTSSTPRAMACPVARRWRKSARPSSSCSTAPTSAKASTPSWRSVRRNGSERSLNRRRRAPKKEGRPTCADRPVANSGSSPR